MFFLIPIGSEEGVRRLPFITIGLIAINTVIFIITSIVVPLQIKEINVLEERLREIELPYVFDFEDVDMSLYQYWKNTSPLDYHEWFETEQVIPQYSEDYEIWQRVFREYKTKFDNIFYVKWGFVPKKMNIIGLFSGMFIHGGIFHLVFNMLYLWMVGCNIEDDWSWKVFLALYVISGVFASLMHAAIFSQSSVPLVGASGAIAGIMGAFMIRHFKTKIRFAYFLWLILVRPLFGTFSIYAGIFFPIWLVMQIACAPGGGASGVAYYVHIAGFAFGAVIGMSLKFFGLEKKYIAPMVEDSFEQLKTSPRMREINKILNAGDATAAIPLLLAVIDEEPENYDAPLMLARIYHEKGNLDAAAVMYNQALGALIRANDSDVVLSTLEEMREKNLMPAISEKNLYNCALLLETREQYKEAAELFGIYVRQFPDGRVRPKALHRLYRLFKDKLDKQVMAEQALAFLKKEHPAFPVQE